MKRSRIHWILFAGFGLVLVGAIALTGGMYYRQERDAQDGTPALNTSAYGETDISTLPSYIEMDILYLNFDPTGAGLQMELSLDPNGELASQVGFHTGPSQKVCIVSGINAFNTNFTADRFMKSIPATLGLDGDINWYPFDTYTTTFRTLVTSGPNCTEEPEQSQPVPIFPNVFGSVQGFSISADVQPINFDGLTSFNLVELTLTARRTAVSRAFAILIFVVMWFLTISLLITTAWYWITGRRVDLPIVGLGTSLLFALPNIQNAQPGVFPRAGIISDLVGYIWNLLIVSLCVVSLIVNWIYRKDGKKKKEVQVPAGYGKV